MVKLMTCIRSVSITVCKYSSVPGFKLLAGCCQCHVEVEQRSVRRPELERDSKPLSLHIPHCLCNQRTVKDCFDCVLFIPKMITQIQQQLLAACSRTHVLSKEMLEVLTDHSVRSCFVDATSCSL